MKKILSVILALFILAAHCSVGLAFAANELRVQSVSDNTDFAIETAEIIKNSENPDSMLRIIGKFRRLPPTSLFSAAENMIVSDDGRFVLQFSSEKELLLCLENLKNNPYVIYAEQDRPIYTASAEEASEYLSWAVGSIEADIYSEKLVLPSAYSSVTVAIIDSGSEDIDFIKDKLVPGYDFADNDTDATDDESIDSHGTFLASIIADCTRNLPVKIMPVRVLRSKSGALINAINGIFYAVDNGAKVINISLGGVLDDCKPLDDALNYAEKNGATVVVCAGNTKSDIENFCPAHNPNAITVTSVNSANEFSESFSNFGQETDLAAPGEGIIGYNALGEKTTLNGTSMSAAFVSSAAAMFRLENPACNTNQVRTAMISCAEDCGDPGWDKYYGWGVLRLSKLTETDVKYVESVSFTQNFYYLSAGETLEIIPVFKPADASNKTFLLSTDSDCISINGNTITAVSDGTATLKVISNDGSYYDTVEITVGQKIPTLKIINNSSAKTIKFGETLKLTAEVTNKPENTTICWYVNGTKCGEGEAFEVSPAKGSITVSVALVDADGTVITDNNSSEIKDSETVTVKRNIFLIIISFFKNLFGADRTVIQ